MNVTSYKYIDERVHKLSAEMVRALLHKLISFKYVLC